LQRSERSEVPKKDIPLKKCQPWLLAKVSKVSSSQ
jgi:hypothetical protein